MLKMRQKLQKGNKHFKHFDKIVTLSCSALSPKFCTGSEAPHVKKALHSEDHLRQRDTKTMD